jgi:hypothetical protein
MHTVRFDMKFVYALVLGAPAALLCLRLLRPDARAGSLGFGLAAPVVLLVLAVGLEMTAVPSSLWMPRMVGSNAVHCLTLIPLLSIAPLAGALYGMRAGAPVAPRLAGAVAGLAAGAWAALVYASNCTDDSPLFVAAWYTIAIVFVAAVGAVAGGRLLRW